MRRVWVTAVVVCGALSTVWAEPSITGTWSHVRDSDGTVPAKGASIKLTFDGKGVVALHAVRPGEDFTDTGTFAARAGKITIGFKQVEWAADHQAYQVDACTLVLPFLAVSSSAGPGTSTWRRDDPSCVDAAGPKAPTTTKPPATEIDTATAKKLLALLSKLVDTVVANKDCGKLATALNTLIGGNADLIAAARKAQADGKKLPRDVEAQMLDKLVTAGPAMQKCASDQAVQAALQRVVSGG